MSNPKSMDQAKEALLPGSLAAMRRAGASASRGAADGIGRIVWAVTNRKGPETAMLKSRIEKTNSALAI